MIGTCTQRQGLLLTIFSPPLISVASVFVLQEKQCARTDLRAMLSMPWFLGSVFMLLEPSITPSPALSPHVVLSLSPQFFTTSSLEESESSQPPCKPRRSCLKGIGRWSLEMTAKIARATGRSIKVSDFVRDHEELDVPDIVKMCLVVVCHHFTTPWSDSTGPSS